MGGNFRLQMLFVLAAARSTGAVGRQTVVRKAGPADPASPADPACVRVLEYVDLETNDFVECCLHYGDIIYKRVWVPNEAKMLKELKHMPEDVQTKVNEARVASARGYGDAVIAADGGTAAAGGSAAWYDFKAGFQEECANDDPRNPKMTAGVLEECVSIAMVSRNVALSSANPDEADLSADLFEPSDEPAPLCSGKFERLLHRAAATLNFKNDFPVQTDISEKQARLAAAEASGADEHTLWRYRVVIEDLKAKLADDNYTGMANKEYMLEAVASNGFTLMTASEELQADPDVVRVAVSHNGHALRYASAALRADPAIVLIAVRMDGRALESAAPKLQADPAVVRAAVEHRGEALRFAHAALQRDPQIVLAAAKQSTEALQFAAPQLMADPDFMLKVVKEDGLALQYAPELVGVETVVLEAVKNNGAALHHASPELKADPAVVTAAVKSSGAALQHASKDLKGDGAVVLEAVKNNGAALQYASLDLKGDEAIVLEAVKDDPCNFKFAAAELQQHPENYSAELQDAAETFRTHQSQLARGGRHFGAGCSDGLWGGDRRGMPHDWMGDHHFDRRGLEFGF